MDATNEMHRLLRGYVHLLPLTVLDKVKLGNPYTPSIYLHLAAWPQTRGIVALVQPSRACTTALPLAMLISASPLNHASATSSKHRTTRGLTLSLEILLDCILLDLDILHQVL